MYNKVVTKLQLQLKVTICFDFCQKTIPTNLIYSLQVIPVSTICISS